MVMPTFRLGLTILAKLFLKCYPSPCQEVCLLSDSKASLDDKEDSLSMLRPENFSDDVDLNLRMG